jgi:hypothetical protein
VREKRPLGCLTGTGIAAALITAVLVAAVSLLSGNAIFSPGSLNAAAGEASIGGVLKHSDLENRCDACHTAFWLSDRMADRCVECHTSIMNELGQEGSLHAFFLWKYTCRDCHPEHRGPTASLTQFDLVTFPHETVGFSLQAHAGLWNDAREACLACHTDTVRTFEVSSCRECHLVEQRAFLVEHVQIFGLDCLACHDGFDRFSDGFDHQASGYPLEGQHRDAECAGCHWNAGTLTILQSTPQNCAACHRADDVHEGRLGEECGSCHNPSGWRDATIDHELTRFALVGAHLDVDCAECHVENQLVGIPDTCYGCHAAEDEHQGRYGTECGECHQPTNWADWTFDHDLSRFPLTGAHVNVPCENCHTSSTFSDVGSWCGACHADPAYHRGLFSSDCNACHSTFSWLPASYNGPHRFPMGHGGGADCQTCHPDSLGDYTCYKCHEHSRSEIREEHDDEGIGNLSNCVRCHPTGREEGGGGDDDDD